VRASKQTYHLISKFTEAEIDTMLERTRLALADTLEWVNSWRG